MPGKLSEFSPPTRRHVLVQRERATKRTGDDRRGVRALGIYLLPDAEGHVFRQWGQRVRSLLLFPLTPISRA